MDNTFIYGNGLAYAGSNYTISSSYGTTINNNETKQMKESTKELYKLTFINTVETEHVYEVLAESLEDAKKIVASGMYHSKDKTLSIDTELVSTEDCCGNEVEE